MTEKLIPLIDLTLATPEENLALDEALLLSAEHNQPELPILRLWESTQYAVILGRAGQLSVEVHQAACQEHDIPILRRCSGGGTVLIGPGCLIYSLILPQNQFRHLKGISETTCEILKQLASSLHSRFPDMQPAGISDLTIENRKVSGNAQRWLKQTLLHHGTLLYDFDLDLVTRYLKQPARQPEYRYQRSHQNFITNLPTTRAALKQMIVDHWQARPTQLKTPQQLVDQLLVGKYRQASWNLKL